MDARKTLINTAQACPECPLPGTVTAGGIRLDPNPGCVWCHGTGLVDHHTLDRYEQLLNRAG